MLRPCSAAIGPVLSRILVVPVCYGPSRAAGSSNSIEIGQSSNWLRTDRGAFFERRRVDAGNVTLPRILVVPVLLWAIQGGRLVELHRDWAGIELAANGSRGVL